MIKFIGNEAELSGWLEAEKALAKAKIQPIPKGWVSAQTYALLRSPKLSESQARKILSALYRAGMADRQKWPVPGTGGFMFIYRLTHSRNGKQ